MAKGLASSWRHAGFRETLVPAAVVWSLWCVQDHDFGQPLLQWLCNGFKGARTGQGHPAGPCASSQCRVSGRSSAPGCPIAPRVDGARRPCDRRQAVFRPSRLVFVGFLGVPARFSRSSPASLAPAKAPRGPISCGHRKPACSHAADVPLIAGISKISMFDFRRAARHPVNRHAELTSYGRPELTWWTAADPTVARFAAAVHDEGSNIGRFHYV